MIVFDIETGPQPLESIRHLMPEFVDDVGEFNPATVKVGNLKDKAKIQEKVDAARAAHAAMVAAAPARREAHEKQFLERAALSPTTGQVLAIGFLEEGKSELLLSHSVRGEAAAINQFWRVFDRGSRPIVGHNIFGFDLPFLVRRSFLLDIDVPSAVRERRYWHPVFVDTMDVWSCGAREYIGLDQLAKCCGVDGKLDGVNGADFAGLLASDPEKAKEYLRRDLMTTWNVAVKLQIA